MINVDEEQYRVPLFLKKNPASAVVLLGDHKVKRTYGEQGVPLTVIIDRSGIIRYRKSGFESDGESELRKVLESLLHDGEKKASSAGSD